VKALSDSANTDLICVPAEDRETLSLLEDFLAPR
jgi:hypothetical protein